MEYGDFASLVQLGVGLHVGTALLQLYGELGVEPLTRILPRIKCLISEEESSESDKDIYNRLESDFEIFRIQLFNEYKRYVCINAIVAVGLIGILIFIAVNAHEKISIVKAMLVTAASLLPALVTLAVLWWDASYELQPILKRAQKFEEQLLTRSDNRIV